MTGRRVEVLGLPVDALTMQETIDRIEALLTEQPNVVHQHVVVNAAKVVAAQGDPVLRSAILDASIINADGMSVVWAARLLGTPLPERVAGIDLMAELVGWAARTGRSIYLLGARREIVDAVRNKLTAQHPDLTVAGVRDGYWDAGEEPGVVASIAGCGAAVVFVALPSPAKELFIARNRDALGTGLVMGVGGSFDVIAGLTSRAPRWMQRAGLEWLHRLLQEPRRMFRRYLSGNVRFVLLLVRRLFSRDSGSA